MMRAAVLESIRRELEIQDVAIGETGPREVLVRTVAAGLCQSGLHFLEGHYRHPCPTVLGHESAGVVEGVGSMVTYVQPGEHIITCLSAFCGHGSQCLSGHMSRFGLVRHPGRSRSRYVMDRLVRFNHAALVTSDPHLLDLCDHEGIEVIALPDSSGETWTP